MKHLRAILIGLLAIYMVALVGFGLYSSVANAQAQDEVEIFLESLTVDVRARGEWQSAGIEVRTGDRLEIEYLRGKWTGYAPGNLYEADGGDSYICQGVDCIEPLPGYPQGGLVGRIGDGPIFAVGAYTSLTAEMSGTLMLRMNDAATYDNQGKVTMRLNVEAAQEVDCAAEADEL